MARFKVGDLVSWNVKRGVNPKGRIVGFDDFGYKDKPFMKAKVEVLEDLSYTGRYGKNTIKKGDVGYPVRFKRLRF